MNSRAYEKLDYSLCLLSAAADGRRWQAPRLHRQLLPSGDFLVPAEIHGGGEQGPRDLQGRPGGGQLLCDAAGGGRARGAGERLRLQVRPGS